MERVMNFKLLAGVIIMAGLTGCASTPQSDYPANGKVYLLQNYHGPEAMDSNEVLNASKQCILYKMRPNVNYLSVRTDQGKVQVPVSVICEPI
jgi:hypothetical protein